MKKRVFSFLLILALSVSFVVISILFSSLFSGCSNQISVSTNELAVNNGSDTLIYDEETLLPKDILDFYHAYMEKCKIRYSDGVDLIYFNNDWEYDAFAANTRQRVVDYSILDGKELSENLFVLHVQISTSGISTPSEKETDTIYHFVALIDGNYNLNP